MSIHKKQKSISKHERNKFGDSAIDYEAQILDQILRILDSLYKMRLIQKISRPIEISSKEKIAQKYSEKVTEMNTKLEKILRELSEKTTYEENIKEKSLNEELTNKNNELRKKIRHIETRFNQIFHEGSFKHYKKIKNMFHLQTDIQVRNIEDWASTCLSKISGQGEVCC